MLAVFAEFEHATIVDRVTAGLERRAKPGRWSTGSSLRLPPHGREGSLPGRAGGAGRRRAFQLMRARGWGRPRSRACSRTSALRSGSWLAARGGAVAARRGLPRPRPLARPELPAVFRHQRQRRDLGALVLSASQLCPKLASRHRPAPPLLSLTTVCVPTTSSRCKRPDALFRYNRVCMWTKMMDAPRKKAPKTMASSTTRLRGIRVLNLPGGLPGRRMHHQEPDRDGRMVCAVRARISASAAGCV